MTAKSATAAKIENENDFDETLYEARRLRAD